MTHQDWRQVWILGSVDEVDLGGLTAMVTPRTRAGVHPFAYTGPLPTGLNLWPAVTMNVVGDLAKPNVDNHCLKRWAEGLTVMAPSLTIAIHIGSSHRDPTCEATILVSDERAIIMPPTVMRLRPMDRGEQLRRVVRSMQRA